LLARLRNEDQHEGDEATQAEPQRSLRQSRPAGAERAFAGGIELRNPLPQPIEIDVVSIRMNSSLQAMFADGAGLPRDLEPYLTSVALLIEDNLAYDKTYNTLSFSG
jgi:hypothetical protein